MRLENTFIKLLILSASISCGNDKNGSSGSIGLSTSRGKLSDVSYRNRGDSGAPQSDKKFADGSVVLQTKAIETTKFSVPGRSTGYVKEQVPGIPVQAQLPGQIQTTDKSVMPTDKISTAVDSKPQPLPAVEPKNATVPAADTATELSFRWTFILLGQSNMAGMGPIAEEDRIPVSNLFKMNRMKEWVSGGEGFNIPAAPEGEFKANAVGEKALGPSRAFGQRLLALVKDPRVKIQIINMAVSGSSIELWGQNEAYYKAILPYIVAAKNTGVFKGFIWHQGESNSGSNPEDYANRLRDLMSRIRTLTDVPKLPVVVGQVGISGNNNEGVNRSHTFISQYDPFFSVASSANLTLSDNVHYSAASYRTFGERFAERWWDIYRLAPTQK